MSSSKILRGDSSKAAAIVPWVTTQKPGPPVDRRPPSEAGRGGGGRQPDSQSEERIKEAKEAGIAEGRAMAEQKLTGQVQAAAERFGRAIAELAGYRDRLRRAAEQDVVMLSIEIARRVLHREMSTDPEALRGLVKAAFDKMDARDVHRVRIHPDQASQVEAALRNIGAPQKIEIIPDRTLQPGGLVFETAHGSYDASVTTQLAEIEKGFAEIVLRGR